MPPSPYRAKRGKWILYDNAAAVVDEAEPRLLLYNDVPPPPPSSLLIMMASEPLGEGAVNDSGGGGGDIDNIDGSGGGNDVNITSFSLSFEILKIFGRFAADLRGAAYDLVESSGKRWIFGLDSTTNR